MPEPSPNSIIQTVQAFISFQSLVFIGFLIIGKRLHHRANRYLLALLMVLGTHMALNLLAPYEDRFSFGALTIAFGYCYGPILNLYARSLAFRDFKPGYRSIWHIVPPVAAFLLGVATNVSAYWFAIGIFVSLTTYGLSSLKVIRLYRSVLSQTRSAFDAIALNWLSQMLMAQFALLGMNMLSVSLFMAGLPAAGQWAELVLFIALMMLVNLVVFKGLQQPELFQGVTSEERALDNDATATTGFTESDLKSLFDQIEGHMHAHQPFLNPGLTVKALSRQLLQPTRNVSQAINRIGECNFSDYVNRHRIRYAQALLTNEETKDQTILDVMLASGFNTKSNFNRAFKANTGMTPHDFRHSLKA